MGQTTVIALRVAHILTAAAWVGFAFFMTLVIPRVGAQIEQAFLKRILDAPGLSIYITTVELTAVVTGVFLYWNASGGLDGEWITSGQGLGFTVGALAALLALVLSFSMSKTLGDIYYLEEESDQSFNELLARLIRFGKVSTVLLIVAVAGMASAQYLN